MEISKLSLRQAIDGLVQKKFSAQELFDATLARIRKLNPKINAFITVVEKPSPSAGSGPLSGIPFSTKDIFITKGIRTTAASRVLENYLPEYDATVVAKIKEAGGVLIGKENCDAWGHGSSTENSDFGITKNPYDLERVAGGSSGGSAAALACDLTFLSIGEDTGGSIRLPASFCNVVGLKPTYGRISRYGSIAMASSLDCVGPMAKTVEDCEIVFNLIAGPDPYDATSLEKENPRQSKAKLQIGVPKEFFSSALDGEVLQSVKSALQKLQELPEIEGIDEVSLPHTEYGIATYYLIQTSEVSSNLARYDGIRYGLGREFFGDEAKRRIILGTFTLSAGYYEAYYKKAMRVRTLICRDFEEVFKKVDLLVAPVSATVAFKIGERSGDPLQMYLSDVLTVTANLAGIPALVLPCGFNQAGLPIGMQIMGPQFSEKTLLRVGKAYQGITDWHQRKPKLS